MIENMFLEIMAALEQQEKPVEERSILFLGITHKIGEDNYFEPQVLDIMNNVQSNVASMDYFDPIVPILGAKGYLTVKEKGETKKIVPLSGTVESVDLTAEVLLNTDCVVLATDNGTYDTDFVKQHAKEIIDLRDMIKENSTVV